WLRSSTRNPDNPALELLRRALKAATSSRNRLTRLAPSIFSLDAEAQDSWEEDKAWLMDYAAMVYRISDEKKGLPPKTAPSASEMAPPAKKGPGIPEDEKGTPLECHAFQSLAAEKKAVIKDAFLAWQTWDRNVRKHKQEFETRNQNGRRTIPIPRRNSANSGAVTINRSSGSPPRQGRDSLTTA